MRVLVIDDSRVMRSIIARMLKGGDFEVFEAVNGKQALERLSEVSPVDVALVDWNMPEINGMEFVQEVRANAAYDAMPVILIATDAEISQLGDALFAGANGYITKPFTRDMLLAKLQLLRTAVGLLTTGSIETRAPVLETSPRALLGNNSLPLS